MLTSFAWVPRGAMRSVPLRTGDSMDQVKQKLMKQNADFLGGDDITEEEEVMMLDAQKAMSGRKDTTSKRSIALRKKIAMKKKLTAKAADRTAAANKDSDNDDVASEYSDDNENNIFDRFGGNVVDHASSDDEDEKEDGVFKDTDLIFVVGRADEEEPKFELFIYDDPQDTMFVHHDANVAAYPLCSTWLSDGQLSMLAVGTMLPFIEIWPLDVMDAVEPATLLGGCINNEDNYKRRKPKKSTLKPGSHTDAVLSLDWNTNAQHVLASGSADHTVKLWDLNKQDVIGTYKEGCNIQTLQFHHTEESLLLSGGFDGNVVVRDCRQPNAAALKWNVSEVVEHAEWCFHSQQIVASTSSGLIGCFEARMNAPTPIWHMKAHDAETTFSMSRHLPGLMATGGKDGFVSLWDIRDTALQVLTPELNQQLRVQQSAVTEGQRIPTQIVSKNHKTGSLLGMRFHPNTPSVLGACGAKGEPMVYTITEDVKRFFTVPQQKYIATK